MEDIMEAFDIKDLNLPHVGGQNPGGSLPHVGGQNPGGNNPSNVGVTHGEGAADGPSVEGVVPSQPVSSPYAANRTDLPTSCGSVAASQDWYHQGTCVGPNGEPGFSQAHPWFSKNTTRKTISDVNVFKRFCSAPPFCEPRPPEEMPPSRLCPLLIAYFTSCKKNNGENYEPESLNSMLRSMERYLKASSYAYSVIQSDEFRELRLSIKRRQSELKALSHVKNSTENVSRKTFPTEEEERILYAKGVIGLSNPFSLLGAVWMNNAKYFRIKSRETTCSLRWGEIQLRRLANGTEYLEYASLTSESAVARKVWALGNGKTPCPVIAYKQYALHRPAAMLHPDAPFYLGYWRKPPASKVWYRDQALGKESILRMKTLLKEQAQSGNVPMPDWLQLLIQPGMTSDTTSHMTHDMTSALPGPSTATNSAAPSTDRRENPPVILSTPHAVLSTHPSTLSTPSRMLPTPRTMLSTPPTMLPTQSTMLHTQSAILPTQSSMVHTQSAILPTQSSMLPTPPTVLPSQSTMLPTSPTMLPTQSSVLPTPPTMLHTQPAMLPTARPMLPTPSTMLHPSTTASTTLPTQHTSVPDPPSTDGTVTRRISVPDAPVTSRTVTRRVSVSSPDPAEPPRKVPCLTPARQQAARTGAPLQHQPPVHSPITSENSPSSQPASQVCIKTEDPLQEKLCQLEQENSTLQQTVLVLERDKAVLQMCIKTEDPLQEKVCQLEQENSTLQQTVLVLERDKAVLQAKLVCVKSEDPLQEKVCQLEQENSTLQQTVLVLERDKAVLQAKLAQTKLALREMEMQQAGETAKVGDASQTFMLEMQKNLIAQFQDNIIRLQRSFLEERRKELEETKRKQWCIQCGKEARLYCCWNTSYCDFSCQQAHWPVHVSTCHQQTNQQPAHAAPQPMDEERSLVPRVPRTVVNTLVPRPHPQQQVIIPAKAEPDSSSQLTGTGGGATGAGGGASGVGGGVSTLSHAVSSRDPPSCADMQEDSGQNEGSSSPHRAGNNTEQRREDHTYSQE